MKQTKRNTTVHTPENIVAVAESVRESPSTSIHRRSHQLNISETSLRRILHKDLGMTLYKVQLIQELKSIDHPMRFCFAKWACDRLTEGADSRKKIFFSDKAHFDIGRCIQNESLFDADFGKEA